VEDLTVKEAKEKMIDVDDAKEKNSAKEKEGEVENLPVAAQVEILYYVEQTPDVIMTKQAVFCVAFVVLFGGARMAHLVTQRDVT
jgi:hypothetical protein